MNLIAFFLSEEKIDGRVPIMNIRLITHKKLMFLSFLRGKMSFIIVPRPQSLAFNI